MYTNILMNIALILMLIQMIFTLTSKPLVALMLAIIIEVCFISRAIIRIYLNEDIELIYFDIFNILIWLYIIYIDYKTYKIKKS